MVNARKRLRAKLEQRPFVSIHPPFVLYTEMEDCQVLRNTLGYVAYSEYLQGTLLQAQVRHLLAKNRAFSSPEDKALLESNLSAGEVFIQAIEWEDMVGKPIFLLCLLLYALTLLPSAPSLGKTEAENSSSESPFLLCLILVFYLLEEEFDKTLIWRSYLCLFALFGGEVKKGMSGRVALSNKNKKGGKRMGFLNLLEEEENTKFIEGMLKRRELIRYRKKDWEVHEQNRGIMPYQVFVGYASSRKTGGLCVAIYPRAVYIIEEPDKWWNMKVENKLLVKGRKR